MMDVDGMEASFELNELVATKVMGWRRELAGPIVLRALGLPSIFSKEVWKDGDGHWVSDGLPFYSTRIEAAWDVVRHMTADGETGFDLTSDGGTWWQATFSKFIVDFPIGRESDNIRHNGEADTAPLAICRAALKAVGAGKLNKT